jgi:hypothetical protein
MPLNEERQVTAERVRLRIGALETHFEQPDVEFSGTSDVVRHTPLDNDVGTVVQPLTAGPLEVTVTGTGFTDEVAELERLRRLQNRPDTRPDSFAFPIQMRHWLYSGAVVVGAVDGNTVPGLGSVDGDGEWKSICEFVVSVVETDE